MNNKVGLHGMIAADRANMTKLSFTFTYIVTPIYIAAAAALLTAFGVLSASGNYTAGLICFGILGALTAALLLSVPYVRRRTIADELRRYDIKSCLRELKRSEPQDEWDFSDEELSVLFSSYGMRVGDKLLYYNHLNKFVVTSNKYRRVGIYICFSNADDCHILLPLSSKSLRLLRDFDIALDNRQALDRILSAPKEAFAEIYDRGRLDMKKLGG